VTRVSPETIDAINGLLQPRHPPRIVAAVSLSRHFMPIALAIAAITVNVARAQPRVRVRAETRIELAPRREGNRLIVEGALRDDLGAPLVDRPIDVVANEGAPDGPRRVIETVRTERGGVFRASFELPLGRWWVAARFDGDDHLHRQEVLPREVLLDREHVRLDVEIDGGSRIDLDRPTHAMIVRAASVAGGAGLDVSVSENGRLLARGTTGEDGSVAFTLESATLGAPSATRLVVRSMPDESRADAQTEVPIVRYRATTLTLDASRTQIGPGEIVRLNGRLAHSHGPLARKAVGVAVDGSPTYLATSMTDDDGAFALTIGWEDLGALDGALVARFETDAPWWGSSVSDPIALRAEEPAGTPWSWIVLSIATSAILFAIAGRRRRPVRAPGGAALPVRLAAIELADRKSILPDSSDVAGRVIDARSERPLGGAIVRARRGEEVIAEIAADPGGRFALSLPPGAVVIEIDAPGYEPARHRATLPHRGEWGAIVIRLRSLRELAWEPLRPVAARLLPSPDLWAVWTGRDLQARARAQAPTVRGLAALVQAIEIACYAPEPPSAGDLEEIRRAATDVEREMIAATATRRDVIGDRGTATPRENGANRR
jgi:hypothetical protein